MDKSNLKKNTLLLSIGTILTKGINIVMIPLFSAWLSTEDYGIYDLLVTYISLLIPFLTLATSDAMFRFAMDEDDIESKRKYVTSSLVINILNYGIAVVVVVLLAHFIEINEVFPFMLLLAAEILNNHLLGFSRATKQLKEYSISGVISTLAIALFVATFVRQLGFGLSGMILGYACGYMAGNLFLIIKSKYWRFVNISTFDKECVKTMIRYSAPLIPNNLSWWIIGVSDRIFINIFLGAASNGIYAIAYKIPNLCASVFNSFNLSWQEAAVDSLNDANKELYYNRIYNGTISIMISLCGGLLALNYFIFHFIFNIRYFSAILYSPILITATVFSSITQFFGGIQISLKNTKANGSSTMIGALVNGIINLVLIKYVGLYAAAISTIVANIVVCIIRYFSIHNKIKLSIDKETIVYTVYFVYLFVSCYVNNIYIAIFNLCLSCVMFLVINRNMVKKVISKINASIHLSMRVVKGRQR